MEAGQQDDKNRPCEIPAAFAARADFYRQSCTKQPALGQIRLFSGRGKIGVRSFFYRIPIMTETWQNHKERSTPLALKSIRWIALSLGRPAARLLLYPITLYYLIFASSQRKASFRYLSRVLDRKPTLIDVARQIHCFASTILDRVYLMTGQFDKLDIEFPAENMPLKYSSQGIGCILLGSHFGSFEVLRSYAVRKCPLPIKILMYEAHSPMIVKVLNALNPDLSNMIIPIGEPDSLLRVRDSIEAGYAVGMLGDRIMDAESEKTVQCNLLGSPVSLPASPVLIASLLEIPVILFFGTYKGGNRYELHFELLAEKIELNRANRQQDIQRWMQKYANMMEKHIQSDPYNWFNFYDYWKEGESSRESRKLDRQQIEALIPHSGKMCLIDRVEYWDHDRIQCKSSTHLIPDHPLRMNGELSSLHLLEYGAQTMGIHGGLLKKATTQGFLAAVRNVQIYIDTLDSVQSEITIDAHAQLQTESGVIYEFTITDAEANLLLKARTTVINS